MTIFSLRRFLSGFIAECSGATAIEYGLLLAGMGLVVAAAISPLGQTIKGVFQKITTALT